MIIAYLIFLFMFIWAFGTAYQTAVEVAQRRSSHMHLMPDAPLPTLKGKKKKALFKKILDLFVPITKNLGSKMQIKSIGRRLVMAGSGLNVPEFLAFKLLCVIFIPIAVYIIIKVKIKLLIVSAVIGFFIPDFWLRQKVVKRHRHISRDLPNVIDLLNLCVGAGLDFMLAVNRVIKSFKPCPLIDELTKFWHENMVGKPRREALRSLAWRVNLPELSSFARTLIQADRMGSPVSEALNIQSEEIRIRRFQRGEEMAMKAPLKLLFPLLFFILPVVLVIVGGPILLQFIRGGIKFF
jgi:tight adherence protein C